MNNHYAKSSLPNNHWAQVKLVCFNKYNYIYLDDKQLK